MSDLRKAINRNRAGERVALPSVCSAHPDVLRAAMLMAEDLDHPIIIEATSNQVNQFGGYTGMKPTDFVNFMERIAADVGCDLDRVTLGGDHLGPQAWKGEEPNAAMEKARQLVHAYVDAGFRKIHLDCAEGCAGEPEHLGDETVALRASDLARVAMNAASDSEGLDFIVGTEVPPPGGARGNEDGIKPTEPEAARHTLRVHCGAFGDMAERIVGLVVQPGVEFSAWGVDHLPTNGLEGLSAVLGEREGICFEAHSTDYQRPAAYGALADAGFAILKVGPALTFAYRQAVYSLDILADILCASEGRVSSVRKTAEDVMTASPGYWLHHYSGDETELSRLRHFGLSDRIRYYWSNPELSASVAGLMNWLAEHSVRAPILRQVFSEDVINLAQSVSGAQNWADALVLAEIQTALKPYFVEGSK